MAKKMAKVRFEKDGPIEVENLSLMTNSRSNAPAAGMYGKRVFGIHPLPNTPGSAVGSGSGWKRRTSCMAHFPRHLPTTGRRW